MLLLTLNSLLIWKTLAEYGLMDFRKVCPYTTILKHTRAEELQCGLHPVRSGSVCLRPHTHTPVVRAARGVGDGRVHFVSDQPGIVQILEQLDLFLVSSSQVGTACIEVPQEHHFLHTHTHTQKRR